MKGYAARDRSTDEPSDTATISVKLESVSRKPNIQSLGAHYTCAQSGTEYYVKF